MRDGFVAVAGVIAALQPLYLYAVTGSPVTDLYTLVWPYDRLGFGPGIGAYGNYTLHQALITTGQELTLWASDLFGWPYVSWIPVVAGLVAGMGRRHKAVRLWPLLLAGIFVSLVVVHMAYWIGAQVYGPRYFYEAHAGLAILAALGLRYGLHWLAGQFRWQPRSAWPAYGLLAALIALNTAAYLPGRLTYWHSLYGISRAPLDQLDTLRTSDRVLIIVRGKHWINYATFFAANSPWLDNPILAAHDINPALDTFILGQFPDREVWYYADGVFSHQPFPYEGSDQWP